MVFAHRCRNFGQVVDAFWRNNALGRPHLTNRFARFKTNDFREFAPQPVNTTVSKLAGNGRYDWKFFIRNVKHVSVASNLLTNCSECILTASLFVLVEHDDISDVKHLNLLKLGMCTELSGHDVERMVGHRCDGITALTYAAGLAENHVKSNRFGHLNGSVEVGTDFRTRASTGEASHEQVIVRK